jgi:hypothetical protein
VPSRRLEGRFLSPAIYFVFEGAPMKRQFIIIASLLLAFFEVSLCMCLGVNHSESVMHLYSFVCWVYQFLPDASGLLSTNVSVLYHLFIPPFIAFLINVIENFLVLSIVMKGCGWLLERSKSHPENSL